MLPYCRVQLGANQLRCFLLPQGALCTVPVACCMVYTVKIHQLLLKGMVSVICPLQAREQ